MVEAMRRHLGLGLVAMLAVQRGVRHLRAVREVAHDGRLVTGRGGAGPDHRAPP